MRLRVLSCAFALGLVAAVVPVSVGAAGAQTTGFGCRASSLRVAASVIKVEPLVANRPQSPCVTSASGPTSVGVPPLATATALTADTTSAPSSGAAHARVAGATVNVAGVSIKATVIEARASASCPDGGLSLQGASSVATLSINGKSYAVGSAPVSITVHEGLTQATLLRVALNETTYAGGQVTQRAIHVVGLGGTALGTDIVISEAIASDNGRCNWNT